MRGSRRGARDLLADIRTGRCARVAPLMGSSNHREDKNVSLSCLVTFNRVSLLDSGVERCFFSSPQHSALSAGQRVAPNASN